MYICLWNRETYEDEKDIVHKSLAMLEKNGAMTQYANFHK